MWFRHFIGNQKVLFALLFYTVHFATTHNLQEVCDFLNTMYLEYGGHNDLFRFSTLIAMLYI